MHGFQRRTGEEKIVFYTDDVVLFRGGTQSSLAIAVNTVEEFKHSSKLGEIVAFACRPA